MRSWLRRLRAHARTDRGAYTVELATLTPIVLLLILVSVQAALYFHARQVALTAAKQGVEAGRSKTSSPAQGAATSREFLARFGNSVRNSGVSTAGSTAAEVRIDVTGSVTSLIPGVELDVSQHAAAPRERWTNP
ncbi:pilus assembly protein [Streptomyces sp. A7024]|uniref:Pilus assembly protein n=1 Tax=Streptomyces coryli TaxID=1128680 RepID=A0A6G4TT59_9ACTN|nr:TadE/TadG family type IV pilus assembly protein [Streptomyces coryli]NGN63209.1 pilus assembly protein [Streptomyces coryli]